MRSGTRRASVLQVLAMRFPSVPPGSYALDIVLQGFRPYRDPDIYIGAGATIERTPVLTLAALADSIVVPPSDSPPSLLPAHQHSQPPSSATAAKCRERH